jgi:hypothetical protein
MTATTVCARPAPVRPARVPAQRARSTTRRTLRRLLAGLLAVTATVFATTLLMFTRVHRTAETVRTRTAPSIVDLAAARLALVQADAAVINSFQTPEGQLTGPGEEFQNQMAIAGQNLTEAAEDNVAGEPGSRRLQLVEELLVTYHGLVGQAVAHFWQPDGKALGVTDLFSASRLLHGPVVTQPDRTLAQRGGILGELDQLTRDQQRALDHQLAASSMTPVAVLTVLVPLLGLLGLLLTAQLTFRRRFRRRINPWLLLATWLLLAIAAISVHSAAAQHHLEDSRATLHQLVADRQRQGSAAEVMGQQGLRELVCTIRCARPGRCGYTVELFISYVAGPMPPAGSVASSRLAAETAQVGAQTAAAAAGAGLQPAIYLLAILAATAVFLGFRPRLAEYRYRPR